MCLNTSENQNVDFLQNLGMILLTVCQSLQIINHAKSHCVKNQVLYLIYKRNLAIISFITDNFHSINLLFHAYSIISTVNIKHQFGLKVVLCVAVHKSTHNHSILRCHTSSIFELHYTSKFLIAQTFPSYIYISTKCYVP